MPNHRSAAKRQRQNTGRQARNSAWKSRMRKAVKQARLAIEDEAEDRDQRVAEAVSLVHRARSRHVVHPGTARRLVSRLMSQSTPS